MFACRGGTDAQLAASRGVTTKLRQTMGMMEAQVESSRAALETLGTQRTRIST